MNSTTRWSGTGLAMAGTLALSGPAEAHTFGVLSADFFSGVAHPFSGIDHLLAMIAVGLWATQLAERTEHAAALYLVPAAFVAMMAAGGYAAMNNIALPEVEAGILVSIVVLGLLIAASPRMPVLIGMLIAGGFALFHGHAHGSEVPDTTAAWFYIAGFVLATALLHGIGVTLGLVLHGGRAGLVRRAGGAGIAAAGVALYILG